jgi:flagellar hook assembly protein FlgD
MAVKIEGTQVIWGVPSATSAFRGTIDGIIESIDIERGGEKELVYDEDGEVVSRVDHGKINTGTINIIAEGALGDSPALPKKGDPITGSTVGGVNFATDSFVESAKVTHAGTALTKIAIAFVQYPDF